MPAGWYDSSGHDGTWSIAGWQEIRGEWKDVEKGDTPLEDSGVDIQNVDRVTFHYVNPTGDDVYFTAWGPWEDWDALGDYIDYILDPYGVA